MLFLFKLAAQNFIGPHSVKMCIWYVVSYFFLSVLLFLLIDFSFLYIINLLPSVQGSRGI